ncbi:hypothetical protein PRIPAC_70441 [Pristionchus pacificus]|uniref:Uncharacterized protein n=1 Tax=Pristionchus pacificus TaxID=54126 RepID=A0A454XQ27_PRIPA|nr:hypothetical protein PRIPAC_70441 [Pristionchus pacificus]|eukprot:PDM80808.1 hypothetical protein PRIPAC_35811 [Pristionchus pacificus]
MLSGSVAESSSSSLEQMKIGVVFKRYLDDAIELMAEPDMVCLHMRGRFSFEVTSSSLAEKTVACEYIGAFSYDDAIKDLLALTYLGKGDKKMARLYLTCVLEHKSESAIHEEMKEEAKKKLTEIREEE